MALIDLNWDLGCMLEGLSSLDFVLIQQVDGLGSDSIIPQKSSLRRVLYSCDRQVCVHHTGNGTQA